MSRHLAHPDHRAPARVNRSYISFPATDLMPGGGFSPLRAIADEPHHALPSLLLVS